MICLPIAVAGNLETKVPTLDLYYRIALDPEKSRRVMAKLTSTVIHSRAGFAVTPSSITAVCMAAALGAVCCQSIYVFS